MRARVPHAVVRETESSGTAHQWDSYSFATLACEIALCRRPFSAKVPELAAADVPEAIALKCTRPTFSVKDLSDRQFDNETASAFRDLVVACWAQEQAARPNFHAICRRLKEIVELQKSIDPRTSLQDRLEK